MATATMTGRRLGGWPRHWLEVAIRAATSYSADRCSLYAAAVTYYALLSLFPMLLFTLGVASYIFLSDSGNQQELIDNLLEQIPLSSDEGRENLEDTITSVVDARGTLGIIGLIGSAWAGSALFTAVRRSLDAVFHEPKQRSFFIGKAIDIAWVLGFGTLLTLSVAATIAISVATNLTEEIAGSEAAGGVATLLEIGYLLLPAFVTFCVFFLLYAVVADSDIPWRRVWPGAIVATIAFEALKRGFAFYVAEFGNFNATYGSLGIIIALLFFIFLSSQIMLAGAEVVRATHRVAIGQAAAPEYDSAVTHTFVKVRGWVARVPVVGSHFARPAYPLPETVTIAPEMPLMEPAWTTAAVPAAVRPSPAPSGVRNGSFGSLVAVGGLLIVALIARSMFRQEPRERSALE